MMGIMPLLYLMKLNQAVHFVQKMYILTVRLVSDDHTFTIVFLHNQLARLAILAFVTTGRMTDF